MQNKGENNGMDSTSESQVESMDWSPDKSIGSKNLEANTIVKSIASPAKKSPVPPVRTCPICKRCFKAQKPMKQHMWSSHKTKWDDYISGSGVLVDEAKPESPVIRIPVDETEAKEIAENQPSVEVHNLSLGEEDAVHLSPVELAKQADKECCSCKVCIQRKNTPRKSKERSPGCLTSPQQTCLRKQSQEKEVAIDKRDSDVAANRENPEAKGIQKVNDKDTSTKDISREENEVTESKENDNTVNNALVQSPTSKFNCKICFFKFREELDLLNHMLLHRNKLQEQEASSENGIPLSGSGSSEQALEDLYTDGESNVGSELTEGEKAADIKQNNEFQSVISEIKGLSGNDPIINTTQTTESINSEAQEEMQYESHDEQVLAETNEVENEIQDILNKTEAKNNMDVESEQVYCCELCNGMVLRGEEQYMRHMERGKHCQRNMMHKMSPAKCDNVGNSEEKKDVSNNSEMSGVGNNSLQGENDTSKEEFKSPSKNSGFSPSDLERWIAEARSAVPTDAGESGNGDNCDAARSLNFEDA